MNRFIFLIIITLTLLITSCKPLASNPNTTPEESENAQQVQTPNSLNQTPLDSNASENLVNAEGMTINQRILTPEGYTRFTSPADSFGEFLQNLPLKAHGSKVLYYNGKQKQRDVYEAVIDLDVGDKDLQQCADAVMRLRAEYLYSQQLFDTIHFNFTNGFQANYSKWKEGWRIKVSGNNADWSKDASYSDDYETFRNYLDMVFIYAGTLSLSQEMKEIPIEDMRIGDVFIQGGSPGHCVIVVDMAESKENGSRLFMLAQGYMPAQDIHILKNSLDNNISPWYPLDFEGSLHTPEWIFEKEDLKRFEE